MKITRLLGAESHRGDAGKHFRLEPERAGQVVAPEGAVLKGPEARVEAEETLQRRGSEDNEAFHEHAARFPGDLFNRSIRFHAATFLRGSEEF